MRKMCIRMKTVFISQFPDLTQQLPLQSSPCLYSLTEAPVSMQMDVHTRTHGLLFLRSERLLKDLGAVTGVAVWERLCTFYFQHFGQFQQHEWISYSKINLSETPILNLFSIFRRVLYGIKKISTGSCWFFGFGDLLEHCMWVCVWTYTFIYLWQIPGDGIIRVKVWIIVSH